MFAGEFGPSRRAAKTQDGADVRNDPEMIDRTASDTALPLTAALAEHYTIERRLGAGGMATVYLARDQKHDRHVAVKVLRPELASAVGAGRFLREIAIASRLQHPHILTLIDSGEAVDGASGDRFLYYVMPYVEGESL